MNAVPLIGLLVTEPLYDGTLDVISEIPLDARLSSSYVFQAEVTRYPVEDGSQITDHVHLLPDSIILEGLISDSPIVEVPTTMQLRGDAEETTSGSRSQEAFDALHQVWQKRLPLTVVTEYMIFEDMILESFEVPRGQDKGGGLWFTASLVKIQTVRTLTATLPPEVVARLRRKRAKTKQARTKNDPEKVRQQSAAAQETATGKVSTPPASSSVAGKAGALV